MSYKKSNFSTYSSVVMTFETKSAIKKWRFYDINLLFADTTLPLSAGFLARFTDTLIAMGNSIV